MASRFPAGYQACSPQRLHVAYPSPGGFSVGEVWETHGRFETWFNENVKPNVPGVQHEVIELHAVVQP
jgi:hypothetical protein